MAATDVGIGHNSAGRVRCIFRAHGDRGYTKLRNAFLQDSRISDETRGLVARLLSLPDDWEVTVQSIITTGKAGRDKVYRMIKEAEQYGYVRPEQARKEAGKFDRQLYLVSDDPEALIERTAQELLAIETALAQPLTDNPEAVKVAENKDISPLTPLPLTAEPFTAEPLTANRTRKRNIEDKITKEDTDPTDLLSNEQARVDDLPAKAKRSKASVPDAYTYDFEEFWKVYPRREGKGEAFKAWQKLSLDRKRRAYVALKAQLPQLQAKARDTRGNFCAFPATWINQCRFDDDATPQDGGSTEDIKAKYRKFYDGVL
jgi:hypothetical protein